MIWSLSLLLALKMYLTSFDLKTESYAWAKNVSEFRKLNLIWIRSLMIDLKMYLNSGNFIWFEFGVSWQTQKWVWIQETSFDLNSESYDWPKNVSEFRKLHLIWIRSLMLALFKMPLNSGNRFLSTSGWSTWCRCCPQLASRTLRRIRRKWSSRSSCRYSKVSHQFFTYYLTYH